MVSHYGRHWRFLKMTPGRPGSFPDVACQGAPKQRLSWLNRTFSRVFVYLALVRKNNSCRDETGLALNWDAGCIFQQAVTCGERPGRRVGVTRSGRINITETTRQLWVAPKDANYGAKVEINTSERKWRRTYKNTQEKRSQITVGLFFPPPQRPH